VGINGSGVVHVGDQCGEHAVGLPGFALQVREYAGSAFGGDDVYLDGVLLPESPAAANSLIPLLVAVTREVRHAVAVLPVQSPRTD
jgi:hypothetical protein